MGNKLVWGTNSFHACFVAIVLPQAGDENFVHQKDSLVLLLGPQKKWHRTKQIRWTTALLQIIGDGRGRLADEQEEIK